jgi:hypothetical protein
MRPLTVSLNWFFDWAATVANLKVNWFSFFFFGLAAPFCLVSNLFDELARCVYDLDFAWRILWSDVDFEEHISVCNNVDVVISASPKHNMLILSSADNSAELVEDCLALFWDFL